MRYIATNKNVVEELLRSREGLVSRLDALEERILVYPDPDAVSEADEIRKLIKEVDERLIWFKAISGRFARDLAIFLLQFLIGALVALLIATAAFNVVLSTMPIWGAVILLPACGILLYLARSRRRLLYGFAEFFIGFITAINVLVPTSFNYAALQPLAYLQVLGGLYIMVRGLDNIARALPRRIEPYWRRIFKDG